MIFVLDDFNATPNNWRKNDTTSHKGSMIDAVKIYYGLRQLIQEPTHTSFVLFLNQPNFHLSTKFSHGIRNSFIFTSKLPSSGSFCKI